MVRRKKALMSMKTLGDLDPEGVLSCENIDKNVGYRCFNADDGIGVLDEIPRTLDDLILRDRINRRFTWDLLMIPFSGDRVLYVEFGERLNGKSYRNEFLGVVTATYKDLRDPHRFYFWAKFPFYKNHHAPKHPHPKPHVEDHEGETFIFFSNDYLTPEDRVSTCYLDKFTRHVNSEDYRYVHEKIMKSYFVARENLVVPERMCLYGSDCTNTSIGHLINFIH